MTRTLFAAAAAAATLLAGCSMDGQQAMSDGTAVPANMTPTDRTNYVMMAGAGDLYEIRSSQLALTRAQRPEVKAFAQMLIAHHTQTTQTVMAAARAAGMSPPPPKLMPMQVQMMAQLRQAGSADFDRTYINQQIPAHEQALGLHSNYARNGDTPQLQTAASSAVPIVQQHLDRARQLATQ